MKQRQTNTLLCGVALAGSFVVMAGLAGCQSEAREPPADVTASATGANSKGGQTMKIEVTSTAFANGQKIPKKYTGEGQDVSPPLSWSGLPEGTHELVLICDDPDAPTAEPWVHWVIYKIPASATGLPEGIPRQLRLREPAGALQGRNSWPSGQNIGYRGPMPPPGTGMHHYHFTLYAVESRLVVEPGLDKKALLQEIEGHVVGKGSLTGTYQR